MENTKITDNIKWRIVGFLEAGKTCADASRHYKVTPQTIRRIWKFFKGHGEVSFYNKCGRKPKLSERSTKMLIKKIGERNSTINDVARQLFEKKGVEVSGRTVRRIAKQNNMVFSLEKLSRNSPT